MITGFLMYHRVNSLADEERLLQQVLELQSQIRAKREKLRKRKTHDDEKYTKIFAPLTKTIKKLAPAQSTPVAPVDVKEVESKEELEPEEAESEEERVPEEEEQVEPEQELKHEPWNDNILEPGELYKEALSVIPRRDRDDGMLGLNSNTHHIGNYIYKVSGNVLHVSKNRNSDEYKRFVVTDPDLWKLLIVLNPSKIRLRLKDNNGKYLPFVHDFTNIANELNLLSSYSGSKKRVKYNILTNLHHGSGGFLFSTVAPPVVVLPSDKQGLLSELYKALAELRAGNTAMRNLVVPLSREAARRHILPKNLLTPDEETWVLA